MPNASNSIDTTQQPATILPSVGYAVLTLKAKQYLTPHYMRVTLTGPDVAQFENCTIGVNNKIFIPPAGINQVHFPVLDPATRRMHWPDSATRPSVRTFTHRGIDVAAQELYLDFALHGATGPAARWALAAEPGAILGLAMWLNKPEVLYPPADWYLLAGDATAIAVIGAMLESMPTDSQGLVCLEVHGPADQQSLTMPANWQVHWVYNSHPEMGSQLPAQLRNYPLPTAEAGSRFGYVAAEASAIKAIRHYLRKELHWEQTELAAYAYWKIGMSEDQVEQPTES